MTRKFFIERTLRQIYGGFPSDDAEIDYDLANAWLIDATALAAKTNYTDSIKLDGTAYVNGSFYTTFKDLQISADESLKWKFELPQLPLGIGTDEGVNFVQIKQDSANISLPLTWVNQSQRSFYQTMRPIPNKVLCYQEGKFIYVLTDILLSQFTATATMISAGDNTDLNGELNVPPDYLPIMVEYMKQQLMFERQTPQDNINDGQDNNLKTV